MRVRTRRQIQPPHLPVERARHHLPIACARHKLRREDVAAVARHERLREGGLVAAQIPHGDAAVVRTGQQQITLLVPRDRVHAATVLFQPREAAKPSEQRRRRPHRVLVKPGGGPAHGALVEALEKARRARLALRG